MDDVPAPRGRAAILEKLRKHQQREIGVRSNVDQQHVATPKPTGRAALLRRLQESKIKSIGIDLLTKNLPQSGDIKTEPAKVTVASITKDIGDVILEEKEKLTFKGTAGKSVPLTSNYVRLHVEKDRGVFEYEIRFEPEVDAKSFRFKMVNQHMSEMGDVKIFDGGACLYLPTLLAQQTTHFECTLPTGEPVIMTVIFKRKKNMGECLHLYNVLFKRIMRVLMYTQMGRNYFNTKDKHLIPQHRLEVFPGFAVSVDELEGGLLLCLDTQHRVLRSQNVYEFMCDLKGAPNFKEAFSQNVIGSCVLTRYNNKVYTIDDISWDTTPIDCFEGRDGSAVAFKDYYKTHYDITIKSDSQPMLINRKSITTKDGTGKIDQMICLVPELCYMTGLTDAMRNDFKVMKDVGEYTRVTPAQRINALRTYLRNVSNSPEAKQVLSNWGLRLDDSSINLDGRRLDSETVFFGGGAEQRLRQTAEWTRAAGEYNVTGPVDLRKWVLFHTPRDRNIAQRFVELLTRMGPSMGCRIDQPRIVALANDRNEIYISAIQEHCTKDVQAAVFICPTIRTDRYSVIKKLCCTQLPIPSQCIMSRTLSNDSKVRAIVQKIAMQINCKLGGTLWTLRFPFKNWMIIGIDVYHSPRGSHSGSVAGFVSSLNESLSRWFSTAIFQDGELSNYYQAAFTKSLEHHRNVCGWYPAKIVIFRDGVGDGQLDHCKRFEIAQFEQVLQQFKLDIPICFVVVQKRISTRIFLQTPQGLSNPEPGTVLDHTVTRRHLYDFFLVPQNVRQGTVNPTHYIVLHDTCNLKADHVQRLAFKLCHLYYNWSGTIRVPAPCLYAHKLASLVGQHIKNAPAIELSDKLFYL